MSDQSRGKSKFGDSLFKTISRLLKFFTAKIPGGRVLDFSLPECGYIKMGAEK